MIVRAERHERDFSIIDNDVLRDERLSFRARGLLGYLLSLPPGAQVSSSELAEHAKEGREAIRASLTELQTCGYLRRERLRDEHGQWTHSAVVYERPSPENLSPVPPAKTGVSAGQTSAQESDDGELGDKEKDFDLRTEGLSLRASPASPTAQPLVGHYVDECRKRGVDPPKNVRARIGREVRALLAEGFSDEWLRASLRVMARDALSPAALPLVLMEYQAHLNGSKR